jgi:hypothetical protein
MAEIRDNNVANGVGAFRGLDDPMRMGKAVWLVDLQLGHDAKDEKGGKTLRRRRKIVQRYAGQSGFERLTQCCAVVFQITARDGRAQAFEFGRYLPTDIATIKIIKPRAHEMIERIGQTRHCFQRALFERLAAGKECLFEIRRIEQIVFQLCGIARFRRAHPIAVTRAMNGIVQEIGQRNLAAERACNIKRCLPATDRTGHRGGRIDTAHGNLVIALVVIMVQRRFAAGRTARFDRMHFPTRFADQPEPVTANAVHVRIGDGDGRGHGDHRLNGIAALSQNGAAGLCRRGLRGGHGGARKMMLFVHGDFRIGACE